MNIRILEVPLDYGASRHGSDMGPSAIRLAGLKERLELLGHKTSRLQVEIPADSQEYEEQGNPNAKYMEPIAEACTALARQVDSALQGSEFPLILGGDHSIALGSIAGFAASCNAQRLRAGVLYVDAHGDFNTNETTPSGNIHGQCMAASCGYGMERLRNIYFAGRKIDPRNVCYVGLRSLDKGEKLLMRQADVTAFTMSDIDRQGFSCIVRQVTSFFAERCDAVHVSFDMDSLDPMYAPGTGIRLPAGLSNREALLLLEEIAATHLVRSAEFVELNPIMDTQNQSAVLAVELIARLLGETIF